MTKSCVAQNRTHNGLIFPSATPCSCCETCITNLKEGDYCSKGMPGSPMPDSICGNGLYCTIKDRSKHPTCEKMHENSRCFQAQRKFLKDVKSGKIGHLQQMPLCDGDGNYRAVTCIPGQNCFCLNEDGERIFGDGLYQANIDYVMHCSCSRLNDRLKALQSVPFFTIRCKADGSFDPFQCFGDACLCIDERTGSPTSDMKNLTMNVNGDAAVATGLRDLPCYSEKIHPTEFNYARPCENLKRRLINTISSRGSDSIDAEAQSRDICNPDGSFVAVQTNGTSAFCVDSNGVQIEDFIVAINSNDHRSMNCKCARSRKLLKDNNYLEVPECCSNGNYRKVACRRGFCHCVDENGQQVSVEVLDVYKSQLVCYKRECD